MTNQQHGEGQVERQVEMDAQQGEPAVCRVDTGNVQGAPEQGAADQDQHERVNAARPHVGEYGYEQNEGDERNAQPRRGMEQDDLVRIVGRRNGQLSYADPLHIRQTGAEKAIHPDRPPVEQVGVLVDAQIALGLARKPAPARPRSRFDRPPAAPFSGGDLLRGIGYACIHEGAGSAMATLGAAQYAKMAESQARRAIRADFRNPRLSCLGQC